MSGSPTSAATAALQFSRELEPFDYLMFRGESDPRARTAILTINMLDTVPDWRRVQTAFDRASRVVVRLRQHVVVPALPVAPAQWVIDPDFDLGFHLRRTRLPENGTVRELLDFSATFLARPFDTARPLWEALLVEGISEGAAPAALLIKIHHAIADGLGSLELFRHLYDFERDVDRGPMPPMPSPEDISSSDLARDAARRLPTSAILGAGRRSTHAWRLGRQFTQHPVAAVQDVSKLLGSAQRVLGPSPVPPSPLLRRRSLGRRFETIEFPLDDLRRAGRAAGGSVNDAYVAGLCGALRMYHEALGVPVDALPFAMPVSLRMDDDPAGGNRFAGARIAMPVGVRDPARRIAVIRQLVLTAVSEPAINILSVIAPIASRLPAALLAALSSSSGGIDVQASNVPGYPTAPYVAGARVTKLLPFGPLPGVPMMVILVTTAGTCYVGAHYDTAAVTHHDLFASCLRDGFEELFALGAARSEPASNPATQREAKERVTANSRRPSRTTTKAGVS